MLITGISLITFVAFARSVQAQMNQLFEDLPVAVQDLRIRLEGNSWTRPPYRALQPAEASGFASGALIAPLGTLGGIVIVAFIGLYGALNPAAYRNGLLALIDPALRPKARLILARMALQLRGWLLARLFSMAAVGVLTRLGLWAAGVPLAIILGLIAGPLDFIPNSGPGLSAVPSLLPALAKGRSAIWSVVLLSISVQTIEI